MAQTCAVYIRKSREEKDKPGHRLTMQRQQLPTYAKAQGWQVEVYDDGHSSAARGKTADLVERARLEADIKAGKIDVVLCIELSRLSRDDSMQDFMAWLSLCRDHGVRLATPTQIIDPSETNHWVLSGITGLLSAAEMMELQRRMKEGRAEAYRNGKYLAGNPPIPYRYDKSEGGLVIDQDQLETFRRMMHLAETRSAKQVAEETGIPHITVRRAIADQRLLFYQGKRLDPETGETIQGQWPAVIDADQAQRIKSARRSGKRGYSRPEYAALLTNLDLFACGYCGRAIRAWKHSRVRKDGTRIHYYGCRHLDNRRKCPDGRMVDQKIIDQKVAGNLLNILARHDEIKRHWSASQKNDNTAEQLAALDRQEKEATEQKRRLINAITEGVIELADAREKRHEIDATLTRVTEERKQLRLQIASVPDWDKIALDPEDWPFLTTEEKREFFPKIIEKITLYRKYLVIAYRFPIKENGRNTTRINLPSSTPGECSKFEPQSPEK